MLLRDLSIFSRNEKRGPQGRAQFYRYQTKMPSTHQRISDNNEIFSFREIHSHG